MHFKFYLNSILAHMFACWVGMQPISDLDFLFGRF
jgi:hypothetical protein